MKAINPLTPTIIARSGITDESYTAWSSGLTPTKEQYYIYNNTIYRSVDGTKTTQNPAVHIADTLNADKLKWVDYGKVNHLKAFDKQNTSETKGVNISYTIDIAQADTIAFFNLKNVENIQIQIQTDTGSGYTTIKTITHKNISYPQITSWLSYINAIVTYNKSYTVSLPAYYEEKRLIISLSNGSNEVAVGNIIIGNSVTLGKTLITLSSDGIDYTVVETSKAGYTTINKGLYLRLLDVPIYNPNIDHFAGMVDELMGTPTAFIATESIKASIVYGFIKGRREGFKNGENLLTIQELA